MKDNILSICLGNNNGKLCGSKNDSILFLNYLNLLYSKKNLIQNWYKPKLFLDENVAEDNIKKYISNFKEKIDIVLVYYSGHGFRDGKINIKTNEEKMVISDYSLIKLINDSIKNDIILYIILDCCYAGSFKIIPYNQIKKINLITSCGSKNVSYESIISEKVLLNNIEISEYKNKISKIDNKIIVGIFTFNLLDQLYKNNFDNINSWYKVFNTLDVWKKMYLVSNQKPVFFWE